MRAGFALDRFVAFDRNQGVPPSLRVPAGTVLSRAETIRRFPTLDDAGLTGAAMWHDYISTESDRLTLSFGLAAMAHGAVLVNYVAATAPRRDGARVAGVRATDGPSGAALDIAARVTVNAAGGGVNGWMGATGGDAISLMKAMNLVTRREAGYVALGARSRSGRNLFQVPWRNRVLFGTWESNAVGAGNEHEAAVTEADIAAFIDEINQAFPSGELTRAGVTLVHRGLVPREERIDDRIDGLITVAGTKYTTARAVAERVTDLVFKKLGRDAVPCRTAATPLPFKASVELVDAVRDEMVVTLADAVIRRTPMGALGCPGEAELTRGRDDRRRGARLVAERTQQEIADVRRFYSQM